jgi:5'-3' exonuclease
MPARQSKLLLLDTASLYFRAFFGVPDTVRAPDGTPVNAVRGLLDFIARLVSTHEPTELVCCWDDDWRPQWRVDLIPSYKAHRVLRTSARGPDVEVTPAPLERQVPIIREVLAALSIVVVGAEHYEADDVIGTLSARATGPVDIVTGDRDLFQLVDDASGVRVLYTARGVGRLEVLDDAAIVAKYAILPEQYVDFAVLRGDSSDGLPGVAGIGEKTAASLLQQYGDLASVLRAADDPGSSLAVGTRSKLRAAADYLSVAPTVVQVARDIDLPVVDATIRALDPGRVSRLEELAERHGLGSSMTRVLSALAEAG